MLVLAVPSKKKKKKLKIDCVINIDFYAKYFVTFCVRECVEAEERVIYCVMHKACNGYRYYG